MDCMMERDEASMRKTYGTMVFINVMWGLSFIFSKQGLNAGFQPMGLAFSRYVLAAAALIPLLLWREGVPRLRREDILPMFLSSLAGITVYYFCEYNGIQRTSTGSASLILAAIPVLTLGAEALLTRTRLRPMQAAGAFLSLAGVALITLSSSQEGSDSLAGVLFIFGASLVWVAYIFLSRRLRQRYSSLSMNAWQAAMAAITLLPAALAEGFQPAAVTWDGWASAAVLALICSALCYYLYGNALTALSPLASAIFVNLIPLTTMAAGVLFLGERLTLATLAGGALIIGSIFLVNLSPAAERSAA